MNIEREREREREREQEEVECKSGEESDDLLERPFSIDGKSNNLD